MEEEYEGEWEVEVVLAKRKNKETKADEFKVQWLGAAEGEDTSWEPREWLEDEGYEDLITAFEVKSKAEKNRAEAEKKILQQKSTQKVAEPTYPVAKTWTLKALKSSDSLANRRASLLSTMLLDTYPSFDTPSASLSSGKKNPASAKKVAALQLAAERQEQQSHLDELESPEMAAVKAVRRRPVGNEKQYLNQSFDDWVSGLEQLLLRDLTLLKCFAACRWDVEASWNEYTGILKILAEQGARKQEQSDLDQLDTLGSKSHDDENMFLLAPTTFYESADILLMVMSFSSSHTFFNASAVSKRWHHVGARMREVRCLAFDTAHGLRSSLLKFGFYATAVCSAGATKKHMNQFLRGLKDDRVVVRVAGAKAGEAEMETVYYDGANGGSVWPLIGGVETDDAEVKLLSSHQVATEFTVLNANSNEQAEAQWPRDEVTAGDDVMFTLYLGRSPTQNSAGRVSTGTHYKPSTSEITHTATKDELGLPALILKGVVMGGQTFRTHLYGTETTSSSFLSPVFSIPEDPAMALQTKVNHILGMERGQETKRLNELRQAIRQELENLRHAEGKKYFEDLSTLVEKTLKAREVERNKTLPPPVPKPRSLVEQTVSLGSSQPQWKAALASYEERWSLVHKTRARWEDFAFSLPAPIVFSPSSHYNRRLHMSSGSSVDHGQAEQYAREVSFRWFQQETSLELMAPLVTSSQLAMLKELRPDVFDETKVKKKGLAAHGW